MPSGRVARKNREAPGRGATTSVGGSTPGSYGGPPAGGVPPVEADVSPVSSPRRLHSLTGESVDGPGGGPNGVRYPSTAPTIRLIVMMTDPTIGPMGVTAIPTTRCDTIRPEAPPAAARATHIRLARPGDGGLAGGWSGTASG
jgi:hypothetical protein